MSTTLPQDQLSPSAPAPSTNGTHEPSQTVLERIQAQTKHFNATYWREKLMQCHVPPDAPADRWQIGIDRVATIFYKAGEGAVNG